MKLYLLIKWNLFEIDSYPAYTKKILVASKLTLSQASKLLPPNWHLYVQWKPFILDKVE